MNVTVKVTGVVGSVVAAGAIAGFAANAAADKPVKNELSFANGSGIQQTISTNGSPSDTSNAFFADLGTNGRTCFTCHRPGQAWSISPEEIQQRFTATEGLDPVFRTNDGSNCEGADVSTLDARRQAFSMLLTKGLIRVGLSVPANAEFTIAAVDDPYHCGAPLTEASMYRRPLPSSNIGFLSTVMWDGRETVPGQAIRDDLVTQASDATTGHAQGAPPSLAQLNAIVDFELALFTAQSRDNDTGSLSSENGRGGPGPLTTEPFCVGINDPLNILPSMPGACASPSGTFNPRVFTIFDDWRNAGTEKRKAVARGQEIFNTRTFVIDNVAGLNGPGDPVGGPIPNGTCTVCHDTPNAGDHSVAMPLDIGLTGASKRTPDMPLYTLRNKTTLQEIQTTDPGRAMVTGKWRDIGKFKGPVLRGLASRAPYFHNGAAATLEDAVEFYNTRFNLQLSNRDKADLVAFLRAL
jgi:cytochrome c peroxidase